MKTWAVVSVLLIIFAICLHEYYLESLLHIVKTYPLLTRFSRGLLMFFTNLTDGFGVRDNIENSVHYQMDKPQKYKQARIYTPQELRHFSGKEGSKGLYIAIMGRVYDVEKGKKFYGPEGGYSFFAGRDATRAFISGDFTEYGLTEDVTGLTYHDYLGIEEWVKFYDKEYEYKGTLVGKYYDEKGQETDYWHQAYMWIQEAHIAKADEDENKKMFPPCNMEWNEEKGSRFWCTNKSGGVTRDWVGVPRQLFQPGHTTSRCACIKDFGPPTHDPHAVGKHRGDLDNPHLKEYRGCDPTSASCIVFK